MACGNIASLRKVDSECVIQVLLCHFTFRAMSLSLSCGHSGKLRVVTPSLHLRPSFWHRSCAFSLDASGRLRRKAGLITNWRSEVSVPVFCNSDDDSIRYCLYKPVAVVMHSGHVPTSGHYTCAVLYPEHVLLCDDNASPQSIPDLTPVHMRLVYGILYTAVL